jgi:hypothetical protein
MRPAPSQAGSGTSAKKLVTLGPMPKCVWMAVVDGALLCVLLCDPCVLGPHCSSHCSLQRACAAQSRAFFESSLWSPPACDNWTIAATLPPLQNLNPFPGFLFNPELISEHSEKMRIRASAVAACVHKSMEACRPQVQTRGGSAHAEAANP